MTDGNNLDEGREEVEEEGGKIEKMRRECDGVGSRDRNDR